MHSCTLFAWSEKEARSKSPVAQEAAGVYRIREPKRNLHGWDVQKRCRRVKLFYPCSYAHCHETMFFDVPGTHHMAAVLLLRHRGLAEWFHSMYNGSIAINLLMTRDEAAGTHVRLWYPFAVLVPMLSMTSACWGHGKGLVRFGILCHCCGTSPGDLASARAYTISIHNAKNKTLSGDTCHMTLKWCRQSRGVSRETSEGAQC